MYAPGRSSRKQGNRMRQTAVLVRRSLLHSGRDQGRARAGSVSGQKAGDAPIERRRVSPSLDQLFGYGRWLRGATEGRVKDVDVAHVMRAGLIGRLHIVDVGSADPEDFVFDLAGNALPLLEFKKPCVHPVRIYVTARCATTIPNR